METDLIYWMLFAHNLPKSWEISKRNKLIIDFLHKQKITFQDFFALKDSEWENKYNLTKKEIEELKKAKEILPNNGFLLEDILNQGYELIPLNSSDYPKTLKNNLKLKSPPLLYIKGNKKLFCNDMIAIVGSRKANDKSLKFTKNIAIKETNKGKVIVSGGAKGVDQTALKESLNAEGQSILVLPQGILTASSIMKKYYQFVIKGDLLILSTFHPKANWDVGLAMGRNKYIYGLSEKIYVAQSDNKGGTWTGVKEGLNAKRKIYIRNPKNNEKNANNLLIEKGGIPVDINGNKIEENVIYEQGQLFENNT